MTAVQVSRAALVKTVPNPLNVGRAALTGVAAPIPNPINVSRAALTGVAAPLPNPVQVSRAAMTGVPRVNNPVRVGRAELAGHVVQVFQVVKSDGTQEDARLIFV